MLTQARLKELLHYDPETGVFTRVCIPGKRSDLDGAQAGFDSNGYVYICVDYQKYPAHRLAWLYMTGEWPRDEIDHCSRVRSDNRWDNLREASHFQNMLNQSIRATNTSGVIGVSWDRQTSKWRAHITIGRKMRSLGRFADKADAIAARNAAAVAVGGEFARVA